MSAPKVAVITGSATGIGRALAVELSRKQAQDGTAIYTVYATDKTIADLADLKALGIQTVELDVQSEDSISQAVDKVLSEAGKVDLLVCNAGIHCGGFLAEIDYSDIEKTFDINVHGTFRVIQGFGPHMMARRKGVIATMCDVQSWFARPFNGPYEGSKASLAIMSEGLSMELASFGVHVTSICAGWVQTNFLENGLTDFSRYENSGSFYHSVMNYFRRLLESFSRLGPSAEEAAKDIAQGLVKPKPERFIYTGASVWSTLRKGFVQQWLLNGLFAWHAIRETGLGKLTSSARLPLSHAVNGKTV